MDPVGGVLAPANEIDDARWVALGDALGELTYARDRELLRGSPVANVGPVRSR
jgi:hypothetical protein